MKEDLIQHIWQVQGFTKDNLVTQEEEGVQVMDMGVLNKGGGPDFSDACIKIGHVRWRGDVEVHCRASDWYRHGHQSDPRYNSVILHVVWQGDAKAVRADGTQVPTLVLRDYLPNKMLGVYEGFMKGRVLIPCGSQLRFVPPKIHHKMLEEALLHRFTRKYHLVYRLLQTNRKNTERAAYQLLGYNFGFKANSASFLRLTQRAPFHLVDRHRPSLLFLEGLLLGQAGLIKNAEGVEGYTKELVDAHQYLAQKHALEAALREDEWQFARLRPANFPTIRIVQFARLLHDHKELFPFFMNSSVSVLQKQLQVKQSAYWQHHYVLGKRSKHLIGGLGKRSVENILINTVVPLLVTYGKVRKEDIFIRKGIDILRSLPAENNAVVRTWKQVGFIPKDAFESQACIELFNNFCQRKRCLDCKIGRSIIAQHSV